METESEPPDGAQAPANTLNDQDVSAQLSASLSGLSVNPSELYPTSSLASITPLPPTTAPPDQNDELQPMPSQNANKRLSAPPSRRSSAAFAPKSQPTSPKLNRKSSSLSQHNEQSPKSSPHRKASHTYSPRPSAAQSNATRDIPAPVTASSIAAEYFKKELSVQHTIGSHSPDTVVIIHDSCYGHRFSRPKISKINLSFIVERPERIKAGVLGLSNAYVRLGERHAGGHSAPHPDQSAPSNRPFVIHKSTRSTLLNSPAVTNVHGAKWMQELTTMCNAAEAKLASGGKELVRPDTPSASSSKPKLHEGDLYLCKESLEAFQGALGGVLDGVDTVFRGTSPFSDSAPLQRKAFVCVRPPGHHCSADMPSGFCWLNNVHVGIEHAALNHGLTHAAIIDFDLHHGDGSQSITWDRNARALRMPKNTPLSKKTSIGYFSLHDINSYPCEDGSREKVQSASLCIENAHGQSIWNVHLQPWKTEDEFWELYQSRYLVLLDKARAFLRAQTQRIQSSSSTAKPKAAIFISAGFDASEWEGEGMQRHKVNVPTEFYARFTSDILKIAEDASTSVEGRVVSVLEGGYSDRALMSGILSHLTGLVGPSPMTVNGGSGSDAINQHEQKEVDPFHTSKHWWSSTALSELEELIRSEPIPDTSRRIRSSELSTFATPTQSFTAKVVDPSKVYRSLSGIGPTPVEARPPTPPTPEVDWATAVHELSKLLIPSDRRVDSCKHEELSEPRVKRERHSSIGLPSAEPPHAPVVQTRGRRAKTPAHNEPIPETSVELPIRAASGTRRRTISDLSILADERPGMSLNGLGLNTELPTTSDSKAFSDSSVSQLDTSQTTIPSAIVPTAAEGVKLGRTRRQSGALADIRKLSEAPPPVPPVPKEVKQSPKKKPTKSVIKDQISEVRLPSSQGNDVEAITSGVKKITLRISKDAQDSKPTAAGAKTAAKAPRKPAAPRVPKAPAVRAPASRVTKASKTTSSASVATNIAGPMEPPTATGSATGSAQAAPILQDASVGLESNGLPQPPSPRPTFAVPAATTDVAPEYPIVQLPKMAPESLIQESNATTEISAPNVANALDSTTTDTSVPVNNTEPEPSNPLQPTEFIPFVPPSQGDTTSSTSVKPESLTWLAPNTNTPVQSPVVKRGKENLPVFTANGPIPFAVPPQKQEPEFVASGEGNLAVPSVVPTMETKKEEASIWDVPPTPQH